MNRHLTLALSLALLILLSGCESGESQRASDALQKISDELSRALAESQRAVKKLEPRANELSSQAGEEVEKLFVFEYRVEEVPASISAAELSVLLNKLGAERWECFWVQELTTELRITCRRRPKSYLRYIPRWFPEI